MRNLENKQKQTSPPSTMFNYVVKEGNKTNLRILLMDETKQIFILSPSSYH